MNSAAWAASRVNSRCFEPDKPLHRESDLTEESHRLAQQIPFWPCIIEVITLARRMGMNTKSVDRRLGAIQERYLVFQEGSWCSRLRPDLSNMDADCCRWERSWL